jgi:ribosome-associated protein
LTIKKRGADGEGTTAEKTKGKGAAAGGAKRAKRAATAAGGPKRATSRAAAAGGATRPRIRASHVHTEGGPRPKKRPVTEAPRKAPLPGPKRTKRVAPVEAPAPEASSAARETALQLAAAALDKKAVGVEILDVTGKIDYADFLVVMTGRSDRHVQAIAQGIEDAMRRNKISPLSTEGLGAATWVLMDFGDVVVHVFQEESRRLYDIEGLWIDASRVPVPGAEAEAAGRSDLPS